jgi:hypothetical protein
VPGSQLRSTRGGAQPGGSKLKLKAKAMLISEFQASAKPKGKYFRASDLGGKDLTLKIRAADGVEFQRDGGGVDRKLAIEFDGQDQKLVVNKTNMDALVLLFGDDTSAWIGETIRLSPARAAFKGSTVDTIKVSRASKADNNKNDSLKF